MFWGACDLRGLLVLDERKRMIAPHAEDVFQLGVCCIRGNTGMLCSSGGGGGGGGAVLAQ